MFISGIFYNFWTLIFIIPIAAIIMEGIKNMYRMRLKHEETLERIRRGVPENVGAISGERPEIKEPIIDKRYN